VLHCLRQILQSSAKGLTAGASSLPHSLGDVMVTSSAVMITCVTTVQLPPRLQPCGCKGKGWSAALLTWANLQDAHHLAPQVRLLPSLHSFGLWLLGAVCRHPAALTQADTAMGGVLVGWGQPGYIIPLMMCTTQVRGIWCSRPQCLPHLAIHWAGPKHPPDDAQRV
jgi:hypothetical protein